MEILQDLVKLISNNKLQQIEMLGNGSDTLTNEFYQYIKDNKVSTDEEAAELLYNESPESYKYKKLKLRLRNKLLSTLFFIDTSKAYKLEIERAYHNCIKTYAAVSILMAKAVRKPAIDLIEKTLPYAEKYEFTEICLFFCRYLRTNYGSVEKNNKKYSKFNDLLSYYSEVLEAELKAEGYYTEIMNEFLGVKALKNNKITETWETYYNELSELVTKYNSHRFLRNAYKVMFLYAIFKKEYQELTSLSIQAVKTLEEKPYETLSIQFSFHLYTIIGYIQLKEYDKSTELAKYYVDKLDSNVYNWYIANYYLLISQTHTGNYTEAYEIVYNVKNEKYFQKFIPSFRQNWLVHEAYIQFLYSIGLIDLKRTIYSDPGKFKIYKFLNEIPLYSKDKRGLNIAILIVHILFLLQKNKYSDIIDRVDALNQYCYRYLRKDDTFRSNCFIKMLLQMPKANFNKIRTMRYAQPFYEKLKSSPINFAEQGIEVEIIPYEDLWELAIQLLD